jgi:SAM-dependent methyltransferase
LRVQRYARFLRRHGRVAEYGCGTAAITTALARHYRHLDLELVAAGIPHVLFHFVRWRFRDVPYVTTVPITPDDNAALPGRYDAIFCLETPEHLPRPLATLQHFHAALRPGGVLALSTTSAQRPPASIRRLAFVTAMRRYGSFWTASRWSTGGLPSTKGTWGRQSCASASRPRTGRPAQRLTYTRWRGVPAIPPISSTG